MPKLTVRDFNFHGCHLRCIGSKDDLWFVAKDVAAALGIVWTNTTLASIPARWRGVRRLLTPHTNQHGLQGLTPNDVVVINEAAVYKLAFRSNKPAAEAFTDWVAEDVIPSIRKTGSYHATRRTKYEKQGKELPWIEEREEGIEARKTFTGVLKAHGVEGRGYSKCTNAVYLPVLGAPASIMKTRMGLKPKEQLRDNLSDLELAQIKLAEMCAGRRIEKDRLRGNDWCEMACFHSGHAVAAMLRASDNTPLRPLS